MINMMILRRRLSVVLIHFYITRFSVFSNGDMCFRFDQIAHSKQNMYLHGHDYFVSIEFNPAVCARNCKLQRMCKSFNYQSADGKCILNGENHLTKPGDMKIDGTGTMVYYSIDDWPEEIGGECTSHTCALDEMCVIGSYDQGCVPNPNYCAWEAGCANCGPQNVSGTVSFDSNGVLTTVATQFQPVACLATDGSRSKYSTLIDLRPEINWYDLNATILKCSGLAKHAGLTYFGIEFYGECWMTDLDLTTVYSKISVSNCKRKCDSGVGAADTIFFYAVK